MSAPVPLAPRPAGASHPNPPVRGSSLLGAGESLLLRLTRPLQRFLPEQLDPFAQTGAIANIALLVAVVSGVVLLVWYSPSVHGAHASLEAARASVLGSFVRSLHRYSSDACVLFVLLHGAQLTLARRVTGPRWVAWVTGVAAVGLLWAVGWTGYWLVWDQRAQLVALGTARVLDVLPIFADPPSRSFLTDAGVGSMLFFMVFFFHMLLPLAMGVALWLHIARLSRPRFLTQRPLTVWVLVSLAVVSVAVPATSAAPARMAVLPQELTIDGWYLLPLALTERLSGGALWALVLVAGAVLFTLPAWVSRGRARPAEVQASKCNGCRQCFEDCPYDAIRLLPRSDGRPYAVVAEVNPDVCVGCGICAGSCDSSAIGLGWLPTLDARQRIDDWVEHVQPGAPDHVAFVCASSAGAGLRSDPVTGSCAELPGYRVLAVPCSGWVHALTVERALRHGARGVLIAGCGPGESDWREGPKWTAQRLAGTREPALRADKVPPDSVRFVRLDRTRRGVLVEEARRFRERAATPAPPARGVAAAAGVAVAALFSVVVVLGADAPYASPARPGTELVVSFKHPGRTGEQCRRLSEDEKAALPAHMRRDEVCERGRADVRLRVRVDGRVVHESRHAPRGVSGDGNSVASETLAVAPGRRAVVVELGETLEPDEWTWRFERTLTFDPDARRVVAFDRLAGFTVHPEDAAPGAP